MLTDTPSTSEINEDGAPTLSIDWELYGQFLEDSNLTDDEKIEVIESLWEIVVSAVDLGFGISSESRIDELLATSTQDDAKVNKNNEGRSP